MGVKSVDNLLYTENKNISGLNSDQILTMARSLEEKGEEKEFGRKGERNGGETRDLLDASVGDRTSHQETHNFFLGYV